MLSVVGYPRLGCFIVVVRLVRTSSDAVREAAGDAGCLRTELVQAVDERGVIRAVHAGLHQDNPGRAGMAHGALELDERRGGRRVRAISGLGETRRIEHMNVGVADPGRVGGRCCGWHGEGVAFGCVLGSVSV